jgi:2-hydroxycyclohexanecarboxyl-CoA dehydrogenase
VVDLGLANARVLVTGGASNIGRGIVHGFAAEGARIVIADVDEAQAAKVRAEALERGAAETELALGDLTADGAGGRAVDPLLERWGGIDVLVNNAGWSVPGFIAADTDRAKWQKTVEINFFSAIACTQAAIPPMREAGAGSIVFIASDAAFGQIRQGIYGATKAALIAVARTTAKEHGRHGIRSNVICPGLVLPDGPGAVGAASLWAAGQDAVFNEQQIEYLTKDIPLRRLTDAADIANAVTWISSARAARQVTGQVISVSGGYTMP